MQVSTLQTPNPHDPPTCQEWSLVCRDINEPYDPSSKDDPRPPEDKIRNWLN